jgi:hypothetical protein
LHWSTSATSNAIQSLLEERRSDESQAEGLLLAARGVVQFSMARSLTRPNSAVLLVTSVSRADQDPAVPATP